MSTRRCGVLFPCFYNRQTLWNTINRHISILGVETSCDDTGAAIVNSEKEILAEALHSSADLSFQFGGVIPQVARLIHEQHIGPVLEETLKDTDMKDIDAIACTVKPGLTTGLKVGLRHSIQLARKFEKPIIPIHHMEAHALTVRLTNTVAFPYLTCLISGGHCLIALAKDVNRFLLLGASIDNSPGQAFDRIARELRLSTVASCFGLSGGAALELMAKGGRSDLFPVSSPISHERDCDFSFAGIIGKFTQEILRARKSTNIEPHEILPNAADFCATAQHVIAKHLVRRLQRAIVFCDRRNFFMDSQRTIVVSGGVACNQFIRGSLKLLADRYDCQLIFPPPELCSDNAVMIAWNGIEKFSRDIDVVQKSEFDAIEIVPTGLKCPFGDDIRAELRADHIRLSPPFRLPHEL